MSARTTRSWGAAELYLGALGAYAPRGSLLEIRYRAEGKLTRFFVDVHARDIARIVTLIGQRTDVYVGCAPRVRRRGGREDIAATAIVWADCDGEHVVRALHAFPLQPTIVVCSGTATNAHAFWALTAALRLHELEDANRRLALALGADATCVDGARILRIPGTLNFKTHPPRPVRLLTYTPARYRPADILAALPAAPAAPVYDAPGPRNSGPHASDPLLRIEPADYVRVLTGREVGRDHKIACPFHDDRTPSLHVYPTPERGWACFGCRTAAGRPLGGDIYKLASLLWDIPATGRYFLQLRDRLDHTFGVRRG